MSISSSIPTVAGLLPVLFFAFVALLRSAQGADTPRAVIDGFVAWAVASGVSAELMGAFRTIAVGPVLILWLALLGIVLGLLWRRRSAFEYRFAFPSYATSPVAAVAFPIVAVVVIVTLFISLTAAPNNWDSQTYHLAKVEHWIQNGSLAHYPTTITVQNALGPLAEVMILHSRLLSGSDSYSILPQWAGMLCSIFAVYRITRQLGGEESHGWIASAFVATLPMGILQSTSTQNDYVAAALLAGFVTLGLEMVKQDPPRFATALAAMTAGAACGAVKPTAYLVGFGFVLWFAASTARRIPIASSLKWGVTAAIILAAIAGPFMVRNLSTYGTIQSPVSKITSNQSVGVRETLDNLIMNTALNLPTGLTSIDNLTTEAVNGLSSLLGLDVNRSKTMLGYAFGMPGRHYFLHEDLGPNPVHTILILGAIGLLALRWRQPDSTLVLRYWCAWFVGIVAFAAILRWQIYNARLQLGGFVLAAPAFAMAWSTQAIRSNKAFGLLALLAAVGFLPLMCNTSRPLIPLFNKSSYFREKPLEALFHNQPQLLEPYTNAVDLIARTGATRIGLVINDWEYPIWRMLREHKLDHPIRIEHIQVAVGPDRFRPYEAGQLSWPLGPFVPDAVIWTHSVLAAPPELDVEGRKFVRRGPPGPIVVFTAAP